MQASVGLRRLSVHADNISVDVAVSAAMPVESLIPAITDVLVATGEFNVGPVATRYALSGPGGVALDASKSLAELEIRDGTVLTLTRPTTPSPPPRLDDAAEAVAATAPEQPWTRRASRLVGAFTASGLAGVSATALWRTPAGAGVAATIGVLTLLAAATAYHVGEDDAGLTLGLIATAFTTLAGWLAVPGGPGAAGAVLAASAAATSVLLIRGIARHTAVFTTLACCAITCLAAATVSVMTGASMAATSAGMVAVSVALIELAPSTSIALARLSSTAIDDARVARAHSWLTSLIAALSISAALGAIGVLSDPSMPSILLATVTGSVLLLRARTRNDIRHSAPSIVCGAVTLGAALVAAALAHPHHALHIACLSMMLSIVALYAGFMNGTLPSTARRGADLLQYFALASVTPLALWLCGLYGAARGLTLP